MRPRFLPPPNRRSKRNPRVKNRPARIRSRASRQLEAKASVDADAGAVVDADEVDAAGNKPSPKPSAPPLQKALSRTCQVSR